MKRTQRPRHWAMSPTVVAIIVALVCVAASIALLRPRPSRPLRPIVLTTSAWAPFQGPELANGGPAAQLVDTVFRQAGYAPTVEYTSWSSALDRVGTGESLGTFPFVSTSDREGQYLVSDPLLPFTYVLFHRTGEAPTSAADLGRLKVARIAGYQYWPELDRAVGTYVDQPTTQAAFEALAKGQVDVVPEGLAAGQAYLASPGFAHDVTSVDHVRATAPWARWDTSVHLLMRRTGTSEKTMAQFNQALAQFRKTVDYQRLASAAQGASDTVQVVDEAEVWLRDAAGKPQALAPHGTTAVVTTWPPLTGADAGTGLVKVKVTNGPLAGREAWFRLTDVELVR